MLCRLALAVIAASGMAFAQTVSGSIFGNVSDQSSAAVAQARVRVTNVATSETRTTMTDARGAYLFPALATGQYRLEVESEGFRKVVREGISVDLSQNSRVDIQLEVGAVSQEVRVVAEAPQVDTREVQLGGSVDQQRVEELPLNGRNVYSLVSILPGTSKPITPVVGSNEGNYVSINGNRQRQTNFLLDGGINNNLFRNGGNQAPNPDAVEEFRLQTSNFDAEYGRLSGGVINVITKSGTNQFHGSLFEFLRNNVLNARNFFDPTVATLRQNQFGGSAGGRIIRNRTFFFGSYQGLRVRNGVFVSAGITPTAAQRAGDLSAFAANQRPNDPLTGSPFPGGIIPTSRLDPVAQNILKLVPLPNTTDGRLRASDSASTTDNQELIKIDHQLTSHHKIFGSLFLDNSPGKDPFASGTQVPNYGLVKLQYNQKNLVLNHTWLATSALLNVLRVNYTSNRWAHSSDIKTSWSDFGSKVTLGALPARLPQIYVNGFWQMGTFGEGYVFQRSQGASDTVNWTRGGHNVKFGGTVYWHRFDSIGNWLGAGQIRFTGGTTRNALADFLIGSAASFRQNNGENRLFHGRDWAGFVQDNWRISRKVTLNLGLRYEIEEALKSEGDALQGFRFGQQSQVFPNAPKGLLFPGDAGVPRSVLPTNYKNFAPRIGIAWDVRGDGRTAIRAGYGIYYAAAIANITSNLQGQPFIVDTTVFGTPNLVEPYANVRGGSPFPYKLDAKNPLFSLPVTSSYVAEGLGMPYVQQYNFTIQRQIAAQWSAQVSYVGNASRKLYLQRDANAPVYIPGRSTAANVNDRRPYLPGVFGEIAQTQTGASAHYDSLQTTLTRRFHHGFTVMASYTRAKSIDIASDDQLNPTVVSFADSNNLRLDRAVSDSNTPNRFVASYLWETPVVKRWGAFGKQVLSGWQINGITEYRSGNPFNITYGSDLNLDGNNTDRPDLVGDPRLSTSRPRDQLIAAYFNKAAFRAPAGITGTAGRNLIYGPRYTNWDLSLVKKFAITERQYAQFRGELFNAFNQVNFGNPNGTFSSPNFGRILSAAPPRIVQFGLKYIF